MSGADWIDLIKLFPPERHSELNILTRTGVELSIDMVLRLEPSYIVYRGRVVGNTDEGRVFFTPYAEIALVYINRYVKEDEVSNIFDSVPPSEGTDNLVDDSQPVDTPAAIDALAALLPTKAPGKGSDQFPRTLSTPAGLTGSRLPMNGSANLTASGLASNIANMTLPPTPAKAPTLIPPPVTLANNDTPQPKGSILERLRAQRAGK